MDEGWLALTGIGIGLLAAAPVGPVNIMCIHRAVRFGFWAGMASGAGAVAADGICAAIAAFGVSAIATFVEGHVATMKVVGSAILIAFGTSLILRAPQPDREVIGDKSGPFGAAMAAFFLAITNPALLLSFLAIFGGLNEFSDTPISFADAGILTVGVIIGSTLWWVFLSTLMNRLRGRLNQRWLYGVNLVAGIALAAFGGVVLAELAIRRFWF